MASNCHKETHGLNKTLNLVHDGAILFMSYWSSVLDLNRKYRLALMHDVPCTSLGCLWPASIWTNKNHNWQQKVTEKDAKDSHPKKAVGKLCDKQLQLENVRQILWHESCYYTISTDKSFWNQNVMRIRVKYSHIFPLLREAREHCIVNRCDLSMKE